MEFTLAPDYKRIFESVHDLYMLLTPEYQIADVSDAYAKVTMIQREQVAGRPLFEVFPDNPNSPNADGVSNLRASLERVKATREPHRMAIQRYDVRKPEAEGGEFETRYWSCVNTPILDDRGEVAHILHRAEDVTKQTQLREEVDRFFAVSIDMMCISSYDGFFKKVNPAFEKTLGFTAEEMCATSYMEFIHPDDIESTKREVMRQLGTKEPTLSFENRYRHKDGSYRLLSWKSAPVGDLMYAAARDITDLRLAEEELRAARDATVVANRELESFSYSVAHDLRAPIRAMMGFGEFLESQYASKLDQEGQDYLRRVVGAAKKMGMLIDGLLDLSRLSRREILRQEVDLSGIAREIAADLDRSLPDRKVEWQIASDVKGIGDSRLLRVILANLLGNAWKYTGRIADRSVSIQFGGDSLGGRDVYFVRDNGVGFDMNYANKLFGAFQRLHGDHEFEGIGIGLATVQRIVNRHGGKIWAEAKPNEGATFYFTLN